MAKAAGILARAHARCLVTFGPSSRVSADDAGAMPAITRSGGGA
jgi:hypothetical protein